MDYQFTIIIPVFNEEENLQRLEAELSSYLKKSSKKAMVLFVNDGSTDNSLPLLKEISHRNKDLRYISFDKNYGLSAAIKAGFDYATTPLVGYMDADLQTRPQDFERLLPHLQENDLVTGIRVERKDSGTKTLSSSIANKFRNNFTRDGMQDTCCPLKVMKTEYAQKIPMFKGLHRFLPAMILLQEGKIMQVPIPNYPRTAGKSKFNIFNRLLGPFIDCFAYLWMKKKYINYKVIDKNG